MAFYFAPKILSGEVNTYIRRTLKMMNTIPLFGGTGAVSLNTYG